jgi:CRP-like cAMP-binding protein
MVYIIRNGEFEVNKKFKKEEVKSFDMSKLIGIQKNKDSKSHSDMKRGSDKAGMKTSNVHGSQIQIAGRQRNIETFKLALLGPGQMFGEEDVVQERNFSSTVVCRSNQGLLFCKLKGNEECWRIILNQIKNKDK